MADNMQKLFTSLFIFGAMLNASFCNAAVDPDSLAKCLTAKGWIMYGAAGCSACATQKSYFGSAMGSVRTINCDEYASRAQIEQCIANRINYTPTWLLVVNGQERDRLEGYQSLDELAAASGCG